MAQFMDHQIRIEGSVVDIDSTWYAGVSQSAVTANTHRKAICNYIVIALHETVSNCQDFRRSGSCRPTLINIVRWIGKHAVWYCVPSEDISISCVERPNQVQISIRHLLINEIGTRVKACWTCEHAGACRCCRIWLRRPVLKGVKNNGNPLVQDGWRKRSHRSMRMS